MPTINFDPIQLTQSLVKCPSITPKDEGALSIVEQHLAKIGFKCNFLKFSGNNSYEVNNLFATMETWGANLLPDDE